MKLKSQSETPSERIERMEKRILSLETFCELHNDEEGVAFAASLREELKKIKKLLDK